MAVERNTRNRNQGAVFPSTVLTKENGEEVKMEGGSKR